MSVVLGAVFGGIAANAMRVGQYALLGIVIGAIIGLLTSPALVYALAYGSWTIGLLRIAPLTALSAYAAGALPGGRDKPPVCMFVAGCTYVCLCGVHGLLTRRALPPVRANACAACGYSREGLADGADCPECGHPL